MASQRKSRIAQSYVQLVPFIDDNFAKELQKQINQALRTLDFSGMSDAMRAEGRKAGRALRQGLESGLGNASPDINTRQMVTEAGIDGKAAGREIRKGVDAGVGSHAPDLNLEQLKAQANGEGKQAGTALKQAIENAASPIQMPQIQGAAAAGQQAGQQAGSAMASAIGEQLAGVATMGGAVAGGWFGVNNAIAQDAGTKEIAASLGLTEKQAEDTTTAIRELYKTAWADEGTAESEMAVESALTAFPKLREEGTKAIQDAAKRALMMNQLYEADVEKVTQVAGVMYANGFASSITEAYDLIDTAYRETPVALRGDMLDTLDEFSLHFSNMGTRGASAIGILKEFTKYAGVYSMQQSAEGMKEVGIKLGDLNDTAVTEQLAQFGLSHEEIAASILEGGDAADQALETVIKHLLGIPDKAERAKAALTIFGEPLNEIGAKNIDSYLSNILLAGDYLGDIRAEAQAAEDTARDTLDVKLKEVAATAVQTFTDIFAPIVEKLIPVMEWTLQLIQDNKELFQVLAVVALIAAAAIGAIMAIGAAGWFIAGVPAALAFAASLWAVVAPAIAAAAPFIAMGLAIAAVLAVALFVGIKIGEFLYNLVTDWEGTTAAIKVNWDAAMEGLRNALAPLLKWVLRQIWGFEDNWRKMLQGMPGFWRDTWQNILNLGQVALDWIKRQFEMAAENFRKIFEPVNEWWNSLFESNKKDLQINVSTNGGKSLPKMATGGDVLYRPGGTDVTVGEVEPETIVNRGLVNRLIESTNKRLDESSGRGGDGVTIIVNPSQGMNEEQLARIVVERLAWEQGRL